MLHDNDRPSSGPHGWNPPETPVGGTGPGLYILHLSTSLLHVCPLKETSGTINSPRT